MMLRVKGLNVYYDAIHALKDVSFEVNEGEIVTLIGANGAGKTTTLHTISGLLRAKTGQIMFMEKEIQNVPAHEILKMGLAAVPEGRRVFTRMTVLENLEMGAFARKDRSAFAGDMERVFQSFPRLKEQAQTNRRDAFGGRTTDAGDGQGDDVLSAHDYAGRAVDGPFAHPGGRDFFHHPQHSRAWNDGAAGGAERADGALYRRSGLCVGNRPCCIAGKCAGDAG